MDEMDSQNIWYFAYGANMSSSVFTGQRKINSFKQVSAVIPEYELCFNVPGVPYSEPALAGIRHQRQPNHQPVHGVAHRISTNDFRRVIATEGGGVAYKTVQTTAIVTNFTAEYGGEDARGTRITIWTLEARRPSFVERNPSARYLDLLLAGVRSNDLPRDYEKLLLGHSVFQIKPEDGRRQTGKWLFDIFWMKVQFLIQIGIIKFRNEEGIVPFWFLATFDIILSIMWLYHDYFHSMLWGRGDGL